MEQAKLTKEDLAAVVGGNIKKLRAASKLSQEELAEKLELSKNFVSLMETGVKFPSAETIVKLCNIFEIEFFELFYDNEKLLPEDMKKKIVDSFSSQFAEFMSKQMDEIKQFKL